MIERSPLISILIPVKDDSHNLDHVIAALNRSDLSDVEVLICDDGSHPPVERNCSLESPDRFLLYRTGGCGPSRARNFLAQKAQGDYLFFLDSDTEPLDDTLTMVRRIIVEYPHLDGFIGSYDPSPREASVISRYKNLSHHFVHQNAAGRISTFWCGCGIIKRDVFVDAGGLNEAYPHPSIEDVEFGMRISRTGKIVALFPGLQVRHLKNWTLVNWVKTDLVRRGIPWIRLMAARGQWLRELNFNAKGRAAALALCAGLLSGAAGLAFPRLLLLAVLFLSGFLVLNRTLFRFLLQREGLIRMALMVPIHMLYTLIAVTSFALGLLQTWLWGAPPLQVLRKPGD